MVQVGRHNDQPPGEDGERESTFVPEVIIGEALFVLPARLEIHPEDIASEPLIRELRAIDTEKWQSVPVLKDGKPTKRTQQVRVVVPKTKVQDLTEMYMRRMGLIAKEDRPFVHEELARLAADFDIDFRLASTDERDSFLKALFEQTAQYSNAALATIAEFVAEAAYLYHGADADRFKQLFIDLGIFGKYVMMREQAKEHIDGV